jgi:hypothetical protein
LRPGFKKKYMKNLFYLVLLILFVACEKEKFAMPDTGRKIVINSLITTDSTFGVNVSSSMMIDDSSKFLEGNFLKNATIVLFENKIFKDSLNYSEVWALGDFFLVPNNYRSKQIFPAIGNEYKIVVSSPGKPDATATTIIPSSVKIERVDTTRIKVIKTEEWQSDEVMICDVVFTDPANEKNFYLFYVYHSQNDDKAGILNYNLTFNDPIIEEELNHGSQPFGVAFSDKSINGDRHQFRVILDGNIFKLHNYDLYSPFKVYERKIYFRLYSITEDYFKYIQSLNLFFKNYKNPLAEPTQVYSNVEGGYGIYAGAAVSSDSIVFTY